jgi:hypothetical protein
MLFTLRLNGCGADPDHRTVDVRMVGSDVVDVGCSPPDLNDRAGGAGDLFRIYRRQTDVELTAPASHGSRVFAGWDVVDMATMRPTTQTSTVLRIPAISHDMRVYCRYRPAEPAPSPDREPALADLGT